MKARLRYAPSPTGVPHVGNIRTALFNYLFTKNQDGEFILRIEDTDQKRSTIEHVAKIKASLEALNLSWDEEYLQSQRLKIYAENLDILKKKNKVYEDEGAWRFRVDTSQKEIFWQDLVHGKVSFPTKVVEDFIVMKSDGYPTYHMASVVDDHLMQISHVMRGDEWISSTPKHLLLYEAFGHQPPDFVHLPPILGQDHKKLSKREGAKSVLEYMEEGYLPEALTNFLALLGWAPSPSEALSEGGKREKEIFPLNELVKEFSIERINKNSPIFNIEKLKWFNSQWIKKLSDDDLAKKLKDANPTYAIDQIKQLVPLIKDRIKTLSDFEDIAGFFFKIPKPLKPKVSSETVKALAAEFGGLKDWNGINIKEAIEKAAKAGSVDRIDTIASVRNIVAGREVTPPLYESLEILGKEETLKRLNDYLKK